MSTAAYRYSGQVWMERWDSAMTTTPLIPKGLNSWTTTSTMVAWARFAASIRAPFTASRLLITSGSQSNNSTRRCRPRAFNPVALLSPIRSSTAPLLRRLPASPLDEKISLLHPKLDSLYGPGFSIARKKHLRRVPRRRAPSPVAAGKRLSASENHSPRARPEPPPDRLRCLSSTFRFHRSAAAAELAAWWRPGLIPFMLGGDHTATVPVMEVIAPAVPGLRVLQLDAHPDTREEFLGERYNYASAMARVMDVVPAERVYQVGMRTGAREEYHRRRPHFFPMYPMLTGHPVDVVRRLLPELQRHPLYVTIDVDVLDPAEAPGTGSPEPGGLRVPELVEIVRMLEGCRVIGGDLVEVAHAWDPSGRTGIAASWVIREALLAWWGELR